MQRNSNRSGFRLRRSERDALPLMSGEMFAPFAGLAVVVRKYAWLISSLAFCLVIFAIMMAFRVSLKTSSKRNLKGEGSSALKSESYNLSQNI